MAQTIRNLVLSTGLLWLVESFLLLAPVFGQESGSRILESTRISELGIGIGGVNYQGDIATNYRFANNRPGATLFYRKVISQPFTLKASITGGFFRAADDFYEQRPFQLNRDATIKGSLIELGVGLEYYFLDYYDFKRPFRFSPYFFTGPNIMRYNTDRDSGPKNNPDEGEVNSGLRFTYTMGAGIKFAVARHWNIGLEFSPRLVFSQDFLDDLTETTDQGRQLSNPHDRDWYFYNGLSVSYTFYKQYCPRPYKNNLQILN